MNFLDLTGLEKILQSIKNYFASKKELTDGLNLKQNKTDDTLTTTDKTMVGAINEVRFNIGNLDNLTTTEKTDLVKAINEIKSMPIPQDGREIELQKGTTHIQWRYVGEIAWINLVSLDEIKGERGIQGIQGVKGNQGLPGVKGDKGDTGTFDTTTEFQELTTTNKTVIGGLNEVNGKMVTDYSGLSNTPFKVKKGTIDNPIIFSELTDGYYSLSGFVKMFADEEASEWDTSEESYIQNTGSILTQIIGTSVMRINLVDRTMEYLNFFVGDSIDYNEDIHNIPITTLFGTVENPIVLTTLTQGLYFLSGEYKDKNSDTATVNGNNTFIIVKRSEGSNKSKIYFPNSVVEAKEVEDEANTFYYQTDEDIAYWVGNTYDLTTTNKETVVNAVNEVNTKTDTNATNIVAIQNELGTNKTTLEDNINSIKGVL